MSEAREFDRVPSDAGLSGLGLIMQATGITLMWMAVYFLVIFMFMPGKMKGLPLLIAVLSGARSFMHYRAGKAVAGGRPSAVLPYVIAAVVHTAVVGGIAATKVGEGFKLFAPFLGLLLVWPAIAFALTRRGAVRERMRPDGTLVSPDRGLMGLANLMTGFGVIGCLFVGIMIVTLFLGPKLGMAAVFGGMIFLVFLARGFMHARAGIRMLGAFDVHTFQEDRDRYYVFGAISTALLMVLLLFAMFRGGLAVMLMAIPLGGLLMAWPSVARNFGTISIEDWADADADQPALRMPADGGLTTLGILLLGYGGLALAFQLLALTRGEGMNTVLMPDLHQMMPGWATWRGAVIAVVTVWAGLEMLTMSSRVKLATLVNVVLVGGLTIWQTADSWALLQLSLGGMTRKPMMIVTMVAQVAVPLVIPVLAVIQARRLPAEEALQRYEDVF